MDGVRQRGLGVTVADEAVSAEMVRAADSFADHCTRALK
jgi:hypothetical protein